MKNNYIYSNIFWFVLVEKVPYTYVKETLFNSAFTERELRKHIRVLFLLESWYLKKIIMTDWDIETKEWRWLISKWGQFKLNNENMQYPSLPLKFKHNEQLQKQKDEVFNF